MRMHSIQKQWKPIPGLSIFIMASLLIWGVGCSIELPERTEDESTEETTEEVQSGEVLEAMDELARQADFDGDGGISEDEWLESVDEGIDLLDEEAHQLPEGPIASLMFERMDSDGDGILTANDDAFSYWDTDEDGFISQEEWIVGEHPRFPRVSQKFQERFDRFFTYMDVDQDGQLSPEEFFFPPKPFDRFDTDGDELLTLDEWPKDEDSFIEADTDGDEAVTLEEFRALHEGKRGIRPRIKKAVKGIRGIREGKVPEGLKEKRRNRIFKHLDQDEDGFIDSTEWPRDEEHFNELDTDQDGVVSYEEFMK